MTTTTTTFSTTTTNFTRKTLATATLLAASLFTTAVIAQDQAQTSVAPTTSTEPTTTTNTSTWTSLTPAQQRQATMQAVTPVPGLALPNRSVKLGAPVDGSLYLIHAEEGQLVEAGGLLVSMDTRVQEQVLAAAKLRAESTAAINGATARRDAAEVRLKRTKESFEKQAVNELELKEAQAGYDEALANLQSALDESAINKVNLALEQARLEERRVRAPFTGIVEDRSVEPGDALRQSDDIMVFVEIDTLKAELSIPVESGTPLAGQTYKLIAGAPVSAEITATCSYVSPVLDLGGQSFKCTFKIPNTNHQMPAGFHVWLLSLDPVE